MIIERGREEDVFIKALLIPWMSRVLYSACTLSSSLGTDYTLSSSQFDPVYFDWQNRDMKIIAIVITLSGLVLAAPQFDPSLYAFQPQAIDTAQPQAIDTAQLDSPDTAPFIGPLDTRFAALDVN